MSGRDGIALRLPERAAPERLVLGPRPGVAPCARAPVRIFLGTEASQFRPERVLVWSIEQVRDPARVYEIYVMKELAGFDRSGWTTGFTNYRFAIPHFAGASGRAIYNDEDQIYLTDPAELFDLEMHDRGFLTISETESSVMLIDCERMAGSWTLEAARTGRKKALLRQAVDAGLMGPLDPHWNARDAEYREGRSHLLHYTTLHTQPWRPFPDRFVYRDNPLGHLWHDLERSTDAAGFQLFGRGHPSSRFALACSAASDPVGGEDPRVAAVMGEAEPKSVSSWDPLREPPGERADALLCLNGLDVLPEDDVPWALDELFAAAERFVFCAVDCQATRKLLPTETEVATAAERWPAYFAASGARRPGVRWELLVRQRAPGGSWNETHYSGGPRHTDRPPRVWLLTDIGAPSAESALALAAGLGWPVDRLDPGDVLAPPWPDLLIAAGSGAAKRARVVRERSRGRSRVVELGGGARACDADLAVDPISSSLFPHPRRVETAAPLVATGRAKGSNPQPLREPLLRARAPRVAVFADATFGESAQVKASQIAALADGGSVWLLRTRSADTAALEAELERLGVAPIRSGELDRGGDGYAAQLALADAFVVGGGSEWVLADTCATGRPVYIAALSAESRSWSNRLRAAVVALANSGPANNRGTVRPQQGLEKLGSRLIARGIVRPPCDLAALHSALIARHCAQRLGDPTPAGGFRPLDDLEQVTRRVRDLLGAPAS